MSLVTQPPKEAHIPPPRSRSLFRIALLTATLATGSAVVPLMAEAPMFGVSPVLTKYVDALPVPPAAALKLPAVPRLVPHSGGS